MQNAATPTAEYLLAQSSLTANQFKVLHAVRYLEQPTLQGVKYVTGLQLVRVEEAVEMLAKKRLVEVTTKGLIAVESTLWCAKCLANKLPCPRHQVLNQVAKDKLKTTLRDSKGDSRSVALAIVSMFEKKLGFKYSGSKWRAEVANAGKLYKEALGTTRNEMDAIRSIIALLNHTVDTSPGFAARVSLPVAVVASGYHQYMASIPKKPRRVREDELSTGYLHNYNIKTKRWGITNVKL